MPEVAKPATPTAVKKSRAPAGEPVVMPRTTSPLGDMQLGALGISFGMLTTEDKGMCCELVLLGLVNRTF